jgi:integrase
MPRTTTPSRKLHLTDAEVKGLRLPAEGQQLYWDAVVPGFGIAVFAGGTRSFMLNFRVRATQRQRRFTIGNYPDWVTTAARARARELRQLIDNGGDPLADIEQERAAPTVQELCDRFEQEHIPLRRDSTQDAYKRMIKLHIRPFFGQHDKVADVRFEDIDRLHRGVTKNAGPYMANRVASVLGKMFNLATRWRMRPDNPVKGVNRNNEIQRQRYLKADELARLIQTLRTHPDQQSADVVRLLILTGCRRGEALSAKWADLDLTAGKWSKPASSTKQNQPHEVPLSAPALTLLNRIQEQQTSKRQPLGTFVFPGGGSSGHVVTIKKSWRTITRNAELNGLRLHDLRHSYASQVISSGASLAMVGALLGHHSPATTQRYAHMFDDPLRKATERVGAVFDAVGETEAKQPVPIRGGRRVR